MAMAEVTMSVGGVDQLLHNFRQLPPRIQRKAVRRAVTMVSREWVKVVKDTLDAGANRAIDTGLLRKSIGFRVKSPRGRPDVIVGIIGPRKGFATLVTRKGKALTKKGIAKAVAGGGGFQRSQFVDPVRYAHLVEGGREARGSDGGVQARPFVAHSYWRGLNSMDGMLRSEIRKGIDFETRKLASGP
jgi:hypothetical protein